MNVQGLDLNLLRVFDAVLRDRSVTAAARHLGLTQPAVSNALARLRAQFEDTLFVRTPSGMDATPFSRELAEPVRQALALLESALSHGPGFDPACLTDPVGPDDLERANGRGLFLIRSLVDHVSFNDRGNSICLTLRRR